MKYWKSNLNIQYVGEILKLLRTIFLPVFEKKTKKIKLKLKKKEAYDAYLILSTKMQCKIDTRPRRKKKPKHRL